MKVRYRLGSHTFPCEAVETAVSAQPFDRMGGDVSWTVWIRRRFKV